MVWTRYRDEHSGGGLKTKYQMIFIEARADVAKKVFWNRFGRNPSNVSCAECCGPDYLRKQFNGSLEDATLDLRSLRPNPNYDGYGERIVKGEPISLEDWLHEISKPIPKHSSGDGIYPAIVIRKEDIGPDDLVGDVPLDEYSQGYYESYHAEDDQD